MNGAILFYTIGRFSRIVQRADVLFLTLRYPWDKRFCTFAPTGYNAKPLLSPVHLSEDIHESTILAWWTRRDDP